MRKKILTILLILIISITYVVINNTDSNSKKDNQIVDVEINEDEYYTSKDKVALYIDSFNKLPNNYITKNDAIKLGFKASKGNLWDVSDKKSIGGDQFFNREKLLPQEKGRKYFEADIDFKGGYRNSKRIVYSNDGLIYYTDDHYDSFILLYGGE